MEKSYPVLLDNVHVGDVRMEKKGLYYDIYCRCKLPEHAVYRLYVCCAGKEVALSILVPDQDAYATSTRIAANKLGTENLQFCVITNNASSQDRRVEIDPEKPFMHLNQLEWLRLQKREDGWYAEWNKKGHQSSETV